MSLLICENLTKRFGRTLALDAVDLQLQAGAPVALIGPNGAGKTTLLSLLSGFIRPSEGSARVLGHAPGTTGLHGKLAVLPQDAQLDPRFAVATQLRHYARLQGMSRRQARDAVTAALGRVDLADSAASKPAELSHGMRKRIAIAQMLLGRPELALLDEPTAGLDPPNVRIIRELIAEESNRTTFIISSHNLDELEKVCESVVFLRNGKLLQHTLIDQLDDADGALVLRLAGRAGNTGLDELSPEDDPSKPATDEVTQALQALAGVTLVTKRKAQEYAIEFDQEQHPQTDVQVLQLLAQRGWRYRQLSRGGSLEDKLFSQA